MPDTYILNENGDPVPVESLLEWSQWFEANHEARVVARTVISEEIVVSTVFLGLDHGFGGPVILFETMIFRGGEGRETFRDGTREEALRSHARAVDIAMRKETEAEKELRMTDDEANMKDATARVNQVLTEGDVAWERVEAPKVHAAAAFRGKGQQWSFTVVRFTRPDSDGEIGFEGAATDGRTVLHLTPEQAERAVQLAEQALTL